MLKASLEARGLKFLLEKQTEALIRGESGRVCRGALQGRPGNSRRPGGDRRRHPPQHGAGRIGQVAVRPQSRHRGQRHHADLRSAHLCGRRMRRASWHRLRPGGTVVRAGQGLRQSPGQLRHRALYRFGDVDQAQGHRHRPVFGRQLHGRRGHRRDRAERPLRRRVQEAGGEERHPGRCRALRRHGRRRLVFPAGQGRPEHP